MGCCCNSYDNRCEYERPLDPSTEIKLSIDFNLCLWAEEYDYVKRYRAGLLKALNDTFKTSLMTMEDHPGPRIRAKFRLSRSFMVSFVPVPGHVIKIKDQTWKISPETVLNPDYTSGAYTVWKGTKDWSKSVNTARDFRTLIRELAKDFYRWRPEKGESND